MAKEKQWLDAEKIWLMHRGGFAAARKDTTTKPEPGKLTIRLEQNGEIMSVDEDDVEKVVVWVYWSDRSVSLCDTFVLFFFFKPISVHFFISDTG